MTPKTKTLAAVASGAAVVATAAYLLIGTNSVQPPPNPPPIILSIGDVGVAWDQSPDDVAGYNVYYGTASHSYANMIDAGTNLSVTVSNLNAGQTYYFAVTAYAFFTNAITATNDYVESDFSDEIAFLEQQSLEMTFVFPTPVSTPTIQQSADLIQWTNVYTRPVSSTPQSVTVRAAIDSDAKYYRAVGGAP